MAVRPRARGVLGNDPHRTRASLGAAKRRPRLRQHICNNQATLCVHLRLLYCALRLALKRGKAFSVCLQPEAEPGAVQKPVVLRGAREEKTQSKARLVPEATR